MRGVFRYVGRLGYISWVGGKVLATPLFYCEETRLCGFNRRGAAEAVMISQISLEGVQYVRLGLWNYERAF